MARKKQDFDTLVQQLQGKYGDAVKMASDIPSLVAIPTGIDNLDAILGGGWPQGRIVEINGPMRTGKSTLALVAARVLEPCLFIDSDGKYDPDYAMSMGINPTRIAIARPDTLEQAFSIMFETMNLYDLGSIIVDSLPSLVSAKERAESDMSKTTGIAPIATMMSRKLPLLHAKMHATGTVLIIINQVRDKMNMANPFVNPYNTPGGHQLKALTSVRVVLGNKGPIKDDKLGNIGQTVAIMVEKSSVSRSMVRTEIPFISGIGFVASEVEATNQLRLKSGFKEKRTRDVEIEEVQTEETEGQLLDRIVAESE